MKTNNILLKIFIFVFGMFIGQTLFMAVDSNSTKQTLTQYCYGKYSDIDICFVSESQRDMYAKGGISLTAKP